MKKILFVFTIVALSLFACQTETGTIKEIKDGKVFTEEGNTFSIKGYNDSKVTTFYIVRHAEKASSMDDPELSPEGTARAQRLAKMITGLPLNLATSTNYKRTTQTANPTVIEQRCEISVYNPSDMVDHFETILRERKGQKVLVIGHSNSVPELLNLFKGEAVYSNISEEEYGRFYIASVTEMGKTSIAEFEY